MSSSVNCYSVLAFPPVLFHPFSLGPSVFAVGSALRGAAGLSFPLAVTSATVYAIPSYLPSLQCLCYQKGESFEAVPFRERVSARQCPRQKKGIKEGKMFKRYCPVLERHQREAEVRSTLASPPLHLRCAFCLFLLLRCCLSSTPIFMFRLLEERVVFLSTAVGSGGKKEVRAPSRDSHTRGDTPDP